MEKRLWLIEKRKLLGLTHQEVATKINISRQYYGLIENGKRDPSVEVAKKIAELFDFSWTIFFENERYKMFTNSA